jgi:DNA-binding beta-propeller fold protein YncE
MATLRLGATTVMATRMTILALLLTSAAVRAEPEIRSLSEVLEGHSVGGVTVDLLGHVHLADFGETVWKIAVNGERTVFATGLYGASGNAIDNQGNLLQSSFYGDFITRIDRRGHMTPLVTSGLSGPVGIAVNRHSGDIYIANCRGNSIAKLAADGTAAPFAKSDLFKCPNGVALDREGAVYVVNFRDNKMLKVDARGSVTLFATVSDKGLGHLCFKNDRFYVTASHANALYEVTLDGKAKRLLGTGERGIVDGKGAAARLSSPNGVGCHPWLPRLYINEFLGESASAWPPRSIIREITLDPMREPR